MKPLHILVLSMFLPAAAAAAQEAAPVRVVMDPQGVTLAEFLWIKRPVIVFADSPNDPSFQRQMEMIAEDEGQLAARDVVVITDTNPGAKSGLRQKFRPRGFSLTILDKDGEEELRKPLPWDVREITRAIDKFPLARQEILERFPAGR